MDKRKKEFLLAFGKRMKNARYALDLTQRQFAEKAAIHINYIGGIERGECNPSLITIVKIAEALELYHVQITFNLCDGWRVNI